MISELYFRYYYFGFHYAMFYFITTANEAWRYMTIDKPETVEFSSIIDYKIAKDAFSQGFLNARGKS